MNKVETNFDKLSQRLEDHNDTTKEYDQKYAALPLGIQLEVQEVNAQLQRNNLRQTIRLTIENMYQTELYQSCANHNSMIHNERHIENVILYAGLISQLEGFSMQEQILALEAAKYHDVGRTDDGRTPHGLRSATILKEELQDKFDEDAIAMIQTAVAYHEPDDDLSRFEQLMVTYQVPESQKESTRKISLCLKDADALDRTRFFQKGITLDPKFLNHSSAKQLVKFACQLQEAYAITELERLVKTKNHKRMKKQLEWQGMLPKEVLYEMIHGTTMEDKPNPKVSGLTVNKSFFQNENSSHRHNKNDSKLQKSRGTKFCAKRH